jgi:hypothetical protein
VTSKLARLARGTTVALSAGALTLAFAGPASAKVPEGWAEPYHVDVWHAILVLVGIPLLVIIVITALVVIPGIRKGERFTPGGALTEDQWLGGPRSGTAELPAADDDQSQAGGASARW